jgi:hypothetical protein
VKILTPCVKPAARHGSLIPIVAVALGFDAVNSEFNRCAPCSVLLEARA